jgi:hypothetical protein
MYFETLLGWKSERPGDAHWMRLMKISGGTMEDVVAAICADIRSAADDKARLADEGPVQTNEKSLCGANVRCYMKE